MTLEKKTVKQLKAYCKKLLYEIVYKRDADWRGYAKCVTCGQTMEARSGGCHVGHWKHGKTKLTYYDPRNTHLQCNKCNTYLDGNLIPYTLFMIRTYGQDVVDEILERSNDTRTWTKKLLLEEARKLEQLITIK